MQVIGNRWFGGSGLGVTVVLTIATLRAHPVSGPILRVVKAKRIMRLVPNTPVFQVIPIDL
jgi:hypothetical protein